MGKGTEQPEQNTFARRDEKNQSVYLYYPGFYGFIKTTKG